MLVHICEFIEREYRFLYSITFQLWIKVEISNFRGAVLMNRKNELGGVRIERTKYRRWGGD